MQRLFALGAALLIINSALGDPSISTREDFANVLSRAKVAAFLTKVSAVNGGISLALVGVGMIPASVGVGAALVAAAAAGTTNIAIGGNSFNVTNPSRNPATTTTSNADSTTPTPGAIASNDVSPSGGIGGGTSTTTGGGAGNATTGGSFPVGNENITAQSTPDLSSLGNFDTSDFAPGFKAADYASFVTTPSGDGTDSSALSFAASDKAALEVPIAPASNPPSTQQPVTVASTFAPRETITQPSVNVAASFPVAPVFVTTPTPDKPAEPTRLASNGSAVPAAPKSEKPPEKTKVVDSTKGGTGAGGSGGGGQIDSGKERNHTDQNCTASLTSKMINLKTVEEKDSAGNYKSRILEAGGLKKHCAVFSSLSSEEIEVIKTSCGGLILAEDTSTSSTLLWELNFKVYCGPVNGNGDLLNNDFSGLIFKLGIQELQKVKSEGNDSPKKAPTKEPDGTAPPTNIPLDNTH